MSKASLVPDIVEKPEEVIGEVNAVIIGADKGWEHVCRAEPFVNELFLAQWHIF